MLKQGIRQLFLASVFVTPQQPVNKWKGRGNYFMFQLAPVQPGIPVRVEVDSAENTTQAATRKRLFSIFAAAPFTGRDREDDVAGIVTAAVESDPDPVAAARAAKQVAILGDAAASAARAGNTIDRHEFLTEVESG
jgi:hypothetical protein